MNARPFAAPTTVRIAAGCFLLYGLGVVIHAVLSQQAQEWQAVSDFPRAVIRLVGCGLIGWGLWHLARWAWWLGVLLGLLWIVAGVASWTLMSGASPTGGLVGIHASLFMLVAVPLLLVAVSLLLLPSSRAAFRRAAAA